MNIYGKVLIGVILVAGLGMFYLATRNLKAHQEQMSRAQQIQQQLESVQAENEILREGGSLAGQDIPGIRKLRVGLNGLLVDRGRVWSGAQRDQVDPQTGSVGVTVPKADPNSPLTVQDKMVLYLFEDIQGGVYLGEFKVEGVADAQVQLTPTMSLSPRQVQRIVGSQATWSLYERMPADRHTLFAGMDQAALANWMPNVPPAVLEQYVRDGQEARPDDPPDRVEDGKYVRPLHDYAVGFRELHRHISELNDEIEAAKIDMAFAEATRDNTTRQIELRQAEIDQKLQPELAEVHAERDMIKAHHEALVARLAAVEAEIDQRLADTKKLAEEWTAMQLDAARQIDERTGEQVGLRD